MSKRIGAASDIGMLRRRGLGQRPVATQGRGCEDRKSCELSTPPICRRLYPWPASRLGRVSDQDERRSYMAAAHNVIHVSNTRRSAAIRGAIL